MRNYLIKYGLDVFFTNHLSVSDIENLGKIISVHKNFFKVINIEGIELNAVAKGSFIHYRSKNIAELPKLGDFVVLDSYKQKNTFIKYILPRKNELKRKFAGERKEDQIIATNIDYAFITISVDEQFNIRKLERIILACEDSQIEPVVVVTKADLSSNVQKEVEEIHTRFSNLKIITTSILQNESITPIKLLLQENKIGAFIGSSGSGKSTLTNMLLDSQSQKTLEVGDKDRGKHTTTHREMFLLKGGGCIIDNPGIKEFALWLNNTQSIDISFSDIFELTKLCKFRNCTHNKEPGCAVQKAISEGNLSIDRYNNYIKLKLEEEEIGIAKKQYERKETKKAISKYRKNLKKLIDKDY